MLLCVIKIMDIRKRYARRGQRQQSWANGSAGRRRVRVRAWRSACCWLSWEDDPGGFPGVVYDRAAVAHGRTHTVAHACAAASWTLSLFSEYVVDAQFLDPRITGAAPSKQMHASRRNARSAIARSTDRPHCICIASGRWTRQA